MTKAYRDQPQIESMVQDVSVVYKNESLLNQKQHLMAALFAFLILGLGIFLGSMNQAPSREIASVPQSKK
ncbi:MAG: hypothetical protein A2622_10395 [Bdellovibrionales bacterium RIFCSPHIGHO2_01_FULL_40_29]|nr:MAG: hypothetical protein A2622_10395 [Bdellovibrionales bacterium RIFCSPHIGHO2_01_FULL_40_29]OFZ34370.1 MAG: hypothetical protein A3D17_00660 [Bdellovibrionales bacterium RIFCSPHIGHO2_02_FULL_40_15]